MGRLYERRRRRVQVLRFALGLSAQCPLFGRLGLKALIVLGSLSFILFISLFYMIMYVAFLQ